MAYYERSGSGRFMEMAIPIILIILVLLVVGAKMFNICPPIIDQWLCTPKSNQVLILTNPQDKAAADGIKSDINTLTKTSGTMVHENIRHITPGVLTSQNYRLVILYGDNTALTNEARSELTDYVENGGTLLIIKGAGLRQLNSDKKTLSPWVFGWAVGDMARIIKFKPSCPITNCKIVEEITVSKDEMKELSLVPIKFDHDIITRWGVIASVDIDSNAYPDFDGAILADDLELVSVADLSWFDAEGHGHTTPALIAYDTGFGDMTGGRVIYLGYNPMQIEQETFFRNVIEFGMKKV